MFPKERRRKLRMYLAVPRIMIAMLVIVLLGAIMLDLASTSASVLRSNNLLGCTNEIRSEFRLNELSLNSNLARAARKKILDMKKFRYWAHYNPHTGASPWDFMEESGYAYKYAGENLAVGFRVSENVCDAWRKSPAHFANLINPNYSEVGFAVTRVDLEGDKKGYLVVQLLGNDANPIHFSAETKLSKCDDIVDENISVVYPGCGSRYSLDKTVVIKNPHQEDVHLWMDGQIIPADSLVEGDYQRFVIDEKFDLGSHRIIVRKANSPSNRAIINLNIVVPPQELVEDEEMDISSQISASILGAGGSYAALMAVILLSLLGAAFLVVTREE